MLDIIEILVSVVLIIRYLDDTDGNIGAVVRYSLAVIDEITEHDA